MASVRLVAIKEFKRGSASSCKKGDVIVESTSLARRLVDGGYAVYYSDFRKDMFEDDKESRLEETRVLKTPKVAAKKRKTAKAVERVEEKE